MEVAAIVLAAGASRRLGRPKQLVEHRGVPLVRRAVEAARPSCDAVIAVLGANADAVRAALAGSGATFVDNAAWDEGIAASIRCGVDAAAARGARAVVILACDQPAIGAAHVARLVAAWRGGAGIAASRYEGAVGVPALFDARAFEALRALRGDRGAKSVIAAARDAVAIDCPEGALDVDVAADLARLDA